ncbi:hypothetical protein M8C21_027411, partial [Ambrosia artemisiifolia]
VIEKENNFKQLGERYRSFPPDRIIGARSDPRVTMENFNDTDTITEIWPALFRLELQKGCKVRDRLQTSSSMVMLSAGCCNGLHTVEQISEMQYVQFMLQKVSFVGNMDR